MPTDYKGFLYLEHLCDVAIFPTDSICKEIHFITMKDAISSKHQQGEIFDNFWYIWKAYIIVNSFALSLNAS